MKATLLTVSLLSVLVSCGRNTDTVIREIPATPTESVTAEQQDVDNLIQDENDYRIGLGQTMLSKGLSCTLYSFVSGDRIQASIAGHNTLASLANVGSFTLNKTFNQPDVWVGEGLNVLPTSLMNTYKQNYMLRCSGYYVVTDTDSYQFNLESDDASILYVDGSKLIDNDNGHGSTNITASKYLRRGVHSIRLDYAQIGGNESLILKVNQELINSDRFVH